MIKPGKKTQAWNRARAKLIKKFRKWGIESCELRFKGCTGKSFTGFAHKDKRRYLSEDELEDVVLACGNCHDYIEYQLPRAQMRETVERVIAIRTKRLNEQIVFGGSN